MTAIKTIIEAENKAEETINNARETVQKDIVSAEKAQQEMFSQIDTELKEDRLKQVREQKVELSALYKKMLSEGEIKRESLKKVVSAKQGKARQFVLDSFVK